MDQQCNSRTLRGSLPIIFGIFKQTGRHTLRATKSSISQQLVGCLFVHSALACWVVNLKHSFLGK